MKKVLIMGCPGAGKAKLAAQLGRITGLDVYHIKDDRYSEWHNEDQKQAWREAVAKIIEKDSWIIEGTQSITYDMRIEAADTVLFIRQKTFDCLSKFIKRGIKSYFGRSDGHQRLNKDMFKKIIAYHKVLKPLVDDLIEKNKSHLDVIFFDTEQDIEKYLEEMRTELKQGK